MNEVYIYDAIRTPLDIRTGDNPYQEIKPVDLLARGFNALRARNDFDLSAVEDALIGILDPGEYYGVNIARAALLKAGWPATVSGVALNRNGTSSLSAINLAAAKIRAGVDHLCVAGGVDSHSAASFSFQGAGPISDPEWLAQTGYIPPLLAADLLATMNGIDREALDRYVLRSFQKAVFALEQGFFKSSLVPLSDRNGLPLLDADALRWPSLSPDDLSLFTPLNDGLASPGFADIALGRYPEVERIAFVHTAANTAPPADATSLLLLGSKGHGLASGLRPIARVLAVSHTCTDPTLMFQGAVEAARKCLHQAGMRKEDVGLWRCNEPFAAVSLYFQHQFEIPDERMNIGGGAIAFGKAIAASGAILTTFLLCELEKMQLQTGLVAVAAEGGLGTALLVEKL
jgi:acetyl-CoA C-acetyltransferase